MRQPGGTTPTSRSAIDSLLSVTADDSHAGDSCTICFEEFESGSSELLALPCEHFFCKACILPWLEKTNSCPVCRHELEAAVPSGGWHARVRRAAKQLVARGSNPPYLSCSLWSADEPPPPPPPPLPPPAAQTHGFLGEADNPLAMAMHDGRGMPPPFGRPMAARAGDGGPGGLVVFPIDDGRENQPMPKPRALPPLPRPSLSPFLLQQRHSATFWRTDFVRRTQDVAGR